jgi:hypothetical protein
MAVFAPLAALRSRQAMKPAAEAATETEDDSR